MLGSWNCGSVCGRLQNAPAEQTKQVGRRKIFSTSPTSQRVIEELMQILYHDTVVAVAKFISNFKLQFLHSVLVLFFLFFLF